jgi:hypothetical protein
MHIYIIGRHLEPAANIADPILEQGRQWVQKGHQVTVLTGSSGSGMDLGRKRIGLLHIEGMTVVVLNMPLNDKVGALRKHLAYLRFSAIIEKQGQMLPKPGMIIAVMPPLEIARAVLKLKSKYSVPLLLEFREALPDYNSAESNFLVKLISRFERGSEEKALQEAAQIVAASDDIAASLKENLGDQGKGKISVVGKGLDEKQLFEAYERAFRAAKNN